MINLLIFFKHYNILFIIIILVLPEQFYN